MGSLHRAKILPQRAVSKIKDLGVYLSTDLAPQNANKMANWVLSVFSYRSEDVLLTLYKSIVRTRLE